MHEYYMKLALQEAKKAFNKGEVPIGCVVVKNNKVISKGYNRIEKTKQCMNHAEIISIKKANRKLKKWRLSDCDIYITLQPCLMCTGAIIQSRISKVIYAAESNYLTNVEKEFLNKQLQKNDIDVISDICKNESVELLQQFFKNRRSAKKRL